MTKDEPLVSITIVLTAYLDPSAEELWDAIRNGSPSFTDAVRSEIRSNLESVSYVRHVTIDHETERR